MSTLAEDSKIRRVHRLRRLVRVTSERHFWEIGSALFGIVGGVLWSTWGFWALFGIVLGILFFLAGALTLEVHVYKDGWGWRVGLSIATPLLLVALTLPTWLG